MIVNVVNNANLIIVIFHNFCVCIFLLERAQSKSVHGNIKPVNRCIHCTKVKNVFLQIKYEIIPT